MIDGGEWESDNKMGKGPLIAPPPSPPTPPSFLLYLQHVHDIVLPPSFLDLFSHERSIIVLGAQINGGPSIIVLDAWVGIVVEQQAHYLPMAFP